VHHDINRALQIYLGCGPEGGYQPIGCEERLAQAYPADSTRVRQLISQYLDEDHEADWSKHGLVEETERFAAALAVKYPELERTTVRALAHRWSYGWK
jgi:hypothetical protein